MPLTQNTSIVRGGSDDGGGDLAQTPVIPFADDFDNLVLVAYSPDIDNSDDGPLDALADDYA